MSNNNQGYRRDRRDRNDGHGWNNNETMPPHKRQRQQYDNRAPNNYNPRYPNFPNNNMMTGNFQYPQGYYHQADHFREHKAEVASNIPEDPNRMKSFKQFISALPDSVTEESAANQYKNYKIEFKKSHAKQFFDKYKEHEWLLEKYHPVQLKKRLEEQRQSRKRRLNAFLELIDCDWLTDVKLDYREEDKGKLELFLDSVIVKLEGGTDEDLRLLLQQSHYRVPRHMRDFSEEAEKLKLEQSTKQNELQPEDSNNPDPNRSIGDDAANNDNNDNNDINEEVKIKEEDEGIDCDDKPSCSGEGLEQPKIKTEAGDVEKEDEEESADQLSARQEEVNEVINEDPTPKVLDPASNSSKGQFKTLLHKPSSIFLRNLDSSVTKKEIEEYASNEEKYPGFLRVAMSEPKPPTYQRRAWVTYRNTIDIKKYCWLFTQSGEEWLKEAGSAVNKDIGKRIRPTSGLFQHRMVVKADIKNTVSLITYLDKQRGIWENDKVEEKPQTLPSKNDSTTEEVNKEEKSEMITIKQEEEAAVANITEPDPSQQLGQTTEDSLATDETNELPQQQDETPQQQDETPQQQNELTQQQSETNDECLPDQENKSETEPMNEEGDDAQKRKNPLLEDVEQYLIEESNTEEHELIGVVKNEDEARVELSRDENLERVLDKLLLYLRVVHSVDYYNATEYYGEDDMPTRIGLVYARGVYPSVTQIVKLQDIKATIRNHQLRLKHLTEESTISEAEQKQLGKIDVDALLEAFVEANTYQISESKWTCTITKKKFLEKKFVRKHILNPNNTTVAPLIEEIKTNAAFFNNYIADPKRPSEITS